MNVFDLSYDGILLSDMGYVICDFDSQGLRTVSNGSKITINTTPMYVGTLHAKINSQYDECLTATFSICKNPCNESDQENMYLSSDDIRILTRWLNRKDLKKIKFWSYDYIDIYFEGTFNIDLVCMENNVIGLTLTMITNRPFALMEDITFNYDIGTQDKTIEILDVSDEIGYIYPDVTIKCLSDGDLTIHNSMCDGEDVSIIGCSENEIITLSHPIIESSLITHKIMDCFNFNFLKIANTYESSVNKITFSLPCKVQITYNPIVKVGVKYGN